MAKSKSTIILGFALALIGGTLGIVGSANAKAYTYVANGENGHVFADGTSHHADPDPRILFQLERDCPDLTW